MKHLALGAVVASAFFASCASKPELVAPEVLVSPYGPSASTVIWAVAPLANESGTSVVDPLMVTDALVARASEVRGVTTVPLNRTLTAMRALKMAGVRSPADARRLADALGVDGIIVGSITAYDPYDPPKIGLMIGLYSHSRTSQMRNPIDPKALQAAGSDRMIVQNGDEPSSMVSEHLDAQNHEVLMNLRRYAEGRHNPRSALGWRAYTASMELYAEFAAHWSVTRLLQEEQLRVTRAGIAVARAAR